MSKPSSRTRSFANVSEARGVKELENALKLKSSLVSVVTDDVQRLTASLNKLSFDYYANFMSQLKKNLVFSPFSVSNLVAMCWFSADSATREQITRLLHVNESSLKTDEAHFKETIEVFFSLLNKIGNSGQGESVTSVPSAVFLDNDLRFRMNNSVYCRSGYLMHKFEDNLKKVFNADVSFESVESGNLRELVEKVNKKSRMITKNSINEMLLNEHVDDKLYMLLMNTLYFEARWKHVFKHMPEIGLFQASDDRVVEVALMKIPAIKLMYVNRPNNFPCKVCELPFVNESFVFTIVLPESNRIDEIESLINYEVFDGFVGLLKRKRVNIVLPRFQIYDHLDYNDLFSKFGAERLVNFGDTAAAGLAVNKSTYKSCIKLGEKGVEASCCSTFTLTHNETDYPNTYKTHPCEDFVCNKPFMFFVREKNTKIILFMGKLIIPE